MTWSCLPTILPALVTPVSGTACFYSPFPSKNPLLKCILHEQIYSQRNLSAVFVTCWFYNIRPWFSAFFSHIGQRAHIVPPLSWFSFGKALICFGQSVSPKHSWLNLKVVQLYFPLQIRMVILLLSSFTCLLQEGHFYTGQAGLKLMATLHQPPVLRHIQFRGF